MEFFIKTLPLTILLCAAWWFYRKGYRDAKKKFQVEHETPKVSINKEAKEHCSHPKGRNDCRYKDKTLLVCLMRKCVYCDVVDSDPSKGYLC